MATVGSLIINVIARTKPFIAGMARVRKSMATTGTAANTMATKMASLARTFAPLAAGAVAIGVVTRAEQFNRAMTKSLAIMDATVDQQKRMSAAAIEVGRTTKFSAREAADAFFFLASAGLDAEQSIAAIPQVAAFAQAGMFDLSLATDLVTDAQSALGLNVDDATQNLVNLTRVTDVLVKANTLANASVQQFSEALTTKAGAALKFANKQIEEGVAVLAAFADQGVKASDAGTALNIILRDLQTKGIKFADQFKAAGVSVFDTAGNMQNMADIVGDLENALKGMGVEQKKATLLQLGFSDKSVVFLQTLLGTSDAIRGYELALNDAGGVTQQVAEDNLTPFNKLMNEIRGSFDSVAIAARPVIDTLSKLGRLIGADTIVWTGFVAVLALTVFWTKVLIVKLFLMAKQLVALIIRQIIWLSLQGWKGMAKLAAAAIVAGGAIGLLWNELDRLDVKQKTTNDNNEKLNTTWKASLKPLTEAGLAMGQLGNALDDLSKEDIAKNLDKLVAAQKKIAAQGKAVFDATRTPAEKYAATIKDLTRLLKVGAITQNVFGRATAQAREEMDSASKAKQRLESTNRGVAAVQRGTTAAFSAIQASNRETDRVAQINAQQLEEDRKQTALQAQLVRNSEPKLVADF